METSTVTTQHRNAGVIDDVVFIPFIFNRVTISSQVVLHLNRGVLSIYLIIRPLPLLVLVLGSRVEIPKLAAKGLDALLLDLGDQLGDLRGDDGLVEAKELVGVLTG